MFVQFFGNSFPSFSSFSSSLFRAVHSWSLSVAATTVAMQSASNTFISTCERMALHIKTCSCLSLEWLPIFSTSKYPLLLEFAYRMHIMGWASVTDVVRFGDMSMLPKPLSAGSVNSNSSTSIMSDLLNFSMMSWAIRSPS